MRQKIVHIVCVIVAVILLILILHQLWLAVFWKHVQIDRVGTFRIPRHWVITEQDERYYISDRSLADDGCIIYLEQSEWPDNSINSVKYIKNYSNEASYGVFSTTSSSETYWFVCLHNMVFTGKKIQVTESKINTICKSYVYSVKQALCLLTIEQSACFFAYPIGRCLAYSVQTRYLSRAFKQIKFSPRSY